MNKAIASLISCATLMAFAMPMNADTGIKIYDKEGNISFISSDNVDYIEFVNDAEEEPEQSTLESEYISIENAVYVEESFPEPNSDEQLAGVEMSDQIMSGAVSYVTITTDQDIEEFFIGIEGVDGYLEYTPVEEESLTRTTRAMKTYVIPIIISVNYIGDCVIIISARLFGGIITIPIFIPVHHLETKAGDIEVKMGFSNDKDIDLHVITPSGIHIYFSNSSEGYFYGDVDGVTGVYEFGLDIDSNPDCSIDGINKENIYIPAEFVENGEYVVLVDMYNNCDYSIETEWTVTSWYKGKLIRPTSGVNPSAGVFGEGTPSSFCNDLVEVMRFQISDAHRERSRIGHSQAMSADEFWKLIPKAQMKKIVSNN